MIWAPFYIDLSKFLLGFALGAKNVVFAFFFELIEFLMRIGRGSVAKNGSYTGAFAEDNFFASLCFLLALISSRFLPQKAQSVNIL